MSKETFLINNIITLLISITIEQQYDINEKQRQVAGPLYYVSNWIVLPIF